MDVMRWFETAVTVVTRTVEVARRRVAHDRRFDSLLLHRMLHYEPEDGSWTWRVRGAKVPAARTTDVCLLIEPDAAAHYCPDCLHGTLLWEVAGHLPCALECRDCGSQFGLTCLMGEAARR